MTTNQITIQEFVQREIIYCVSSLVYTLTQENKLDEELAFSLWQGKVDYETAEYEINQAGGTLQQEDGYWGVYGDNVHYWLIDPCHNSKDDAIDDYFASTAPISASTGVGSSDRRFDVGSSDGDLDEYRQEVFEHWIVSNWLFNKLQEHGETVVELYGLNIWCRTTTGMAIAYDYVIQEIYNNLINPRRD